ncbi:hypothetical protein TNCV_607341 [Trichonephila clavipes]|nr:hypothetical protein TNCV_607341 [Trichonephila clavipes]
MNASVVQQQVFSEFLQGVQDTVQQNVWFVHDDAPAHFSIAVPMPMLDIPECVDWTRRTYYLASTLPRHQSLGFLFLEPPYITFCVNRWWLQWLPRHGMLSLTLPAHQICKNPYDSPSSIGVGSSMTYVVATSNNFCDNHLSLNL